MTRTAFAAAALAAALLAPTMALAADAPCLEIVVVYGAVKSPDAKPAGEAAADHAIPALPVVYEEPAQKPAAAPTAR
ncbi:MAG TPA: hypothetical protein VHZ78_01780 [Rhizomicrobium sp.]|jgi:hypothetical protein|nr:hypothetical protein [Rhizomicrobium sp.]